MHRFAVVLALVLVVAACSDSGSSTTTTAPDGTSTSTVNGSTTTTAPDGTSTSNPDGTTTTAGDGSTTTTSADTTTTSAGDSSTTTTAGDGSTTTSAGDSSTTTTAGDGSTTTTEAGSSSTTPPPTVPPSGDKLEIEGVTVGLLLVCAGESEEGTTYRAASEAGDGLSLFVIDGELDAIDIFNAAGTFFGDGSDFSTDIAGGRLAGDGVVFSSDPDEVDPVAVSFEIPVDPGACPGLRGDGLSVADFGASGDDAVADLSTLLGPPLDDSGWFDAADGGCRGTVVRFVIWDDAFILLTDAATDYAGEGTRHFAFWGAPEGTAFASPDGIQPGITTLGDVPGANPVFDETYELFIFEVDGVIYEVESANPSELIIGASAGDAVICGG